MICLKYIELESSNGLWLGTIYLKVQKENKIQYITKEYPKLGIVSSNYNDKLNNIIRWNKKTLYHPSCKVRKIIEKVPISDVSKIFD
jgi:hypothetical protein